MPRAMWTFMLRIQGRDPHRIPMSRLAEYIRLFAELLGPENAPVFKGVRRASTGIRALVAQDRKEATYRRLHEANQDANSRAARPLREIEGLLSVDRVSSAQLLNAANDVIYVIRSRLEPEQETVRIYQTGIVDGCVTGLVGADDTMHLHLRDYVDRDFRLIVRDEALARELLQHFRSGLVRLRARGTWVRTEHGWIPEPSKCTVESFTVLESVPLPDVFASIAAVEGDGWGSVENAAYLWEQLRGPH